VKHFLFVHLPQQPVNTDNSGSEGNNWSIETLASKLSMVTKITGNFSKSAAKVAVAYCKQW